MNLDKLTGMIAPMITPFDKNEELDLNIARKEIKYFAKEIEEAKWIIDKETFCVVEKTEANIRKKGVKIGLGKDEQYKQLGKFYMNKGNYKRAEGIFRRAIEIDPGNEDILEILEKNFEDIR